MAATTDRSDAHDQQLTLQLTLTAEQGQPRVPVTIQRAATCTELRQIVHDTTHIPMDKLKLIYRGRLISEDDSKNAVSEFKLENDSVLHCMGKPINRAEAASAPTSLSAASAPDASTLPAGASITMQAPTAAAAAAAAAPSSTSSADPMQTALNELRSRNSPPTYTTALTTLEKILTNIVDNPMEEKYRKVKQSNAAFTKRLGGLPGGNAAMLAAGFRNTTEENGEPVYLLEANPAAWPRLVATKEKVQRAAAAAKSATGATASPPSALAASSGIGNGGGNLFDAMPPGVADIMRDPAQMQAMMQNPMVQHMMRSDPRFANDPMMREAFEQITNNPQMMQQVAQLMSDPVQLQRMQQMASRLQGTGGGAVGGGAAPPSGNVPDAAQMQRMAHMMQVMQSMNSAGGGGGGGGSGAQQSRSSTGQRPPQQARSDEDMTEEDMIAEAIRRSLEDNNNNGSGGS